MAHDISRYSRVVDDQAWITKQRNFAHWTDRKWQTLLDVNGETYRLELEWRSGLTEDSGWYLYSSQYFGVRMSRRLDEAMRLAVMWTIEGPQW